jgi:hypothetical protein
MRTHAAGIRSALWGRARDRFGLAHCESAMKKIRETSQQDEPIGIIISRGDRTEQRPVFSAYIWGPAPEPVLEPSTKVA